MTRTVIDLDDALLASVAKQLGTSTKADTVHAALREVLANRPRAVALTRLRDAATDGAFDLNLLRDKQFYRPPGQAVLPAMIAEQGRRSLVAAATVTRRVAMPHSPRGRATQAARASAIRRRDRRATRGFQPEQNASGYHTVTRWLTIFRENLQV